MFRMHARLRSMFSKMDDMSRHIILAPRDHGGTLDMLELCWSVHRGWIVGLLGTGTDRSGCRTRYRLFSTRVGHGGENQVVHDL